MRILVTGASGLAGGVIAEYLSVRGYAVVGVRHKKVLLTSYPLVECDLSSPLSLDGNFDVIIHAAGSLPYNTSDIRDFKRNNIDSMVNLIEFAKKKRVPRIIYLSTIGIYGEFREEIINEGSDRINLNAYGLTKYIAEQLLQVESDIEGISLRMPGIIGKGCRGVWLPNTVERFRHNEDVKIYSPDFQTKNFVWVEDLAKFLDKLIQMDSWKYDVINLACSQSASVREIVMEMKRLTKSSSKIIVDDSMRKSFCLDNSRALEMGYEGISPIEIVRRYIQCASS